MKALAAVLGSLAGLLALAGVLYDSGVARPLLESFYYRWLASSDAGAERAYRELLSGDRGKAVELFREAVERDRESPYRWCDYGEALLAAGRCQEARKCMMRAAELGPYVPPILMRTANFHFRAGENERALSYTRRILKLVGEYDDAIFGTWDRMGLRTREVLQRGLPERRAAQAYLRHVIGTGPASAAEEVWEWVQRHGYADKELANEYVDSLLRAGRYDAAVQSWAQYAGPAEPGYPETNAIYNGGFEREPGKTPFDWRVDPVKGARVEREASEAVEGRWALQLIFDRTSNLSFGNVTERVRVRPGWYRFEAWVRTEEITTDQGIGFRIWDPAGHSEVRTERLRGTNAWTKLEAAVAVGTGTEMMEVGVFRDKSLKFDNKLGGKAWIDKVTMRRQ